MSTGIVSEKRTHPYLFLWLLLAPRSHTPLRRSRGLGFLGWGFSLTDLLPVYAAHERSIASFCLLSWADVVLMAQASEAFLTLV